MFNLDYIAKEDYITKEDIKEQIQIGQKFPTIH